MKTLSEAVQVQIISEAGSTYRNFLLSAYKEDPDNIQTGIENATKAAINFINTVVAKMK